MVSNPPSRSSMAHPLSSPVKPKPLGQAFLAVTLGLGLLVVLIGLLPGAYGYVYDGRIYPGVSVAGIDLSGMTTPQAEDLLAQRLDYPQRGKIVFQEGTNLWTAKPADLGLFLDAQTSALAAYNLGRAGSQSKRITDRWTAWSSGVDLAPLFVFDKRIAQNYLQGIAQQIDRPIIEATLGVNGVEVVVNSGQVGRALDVDTALTNLDTQLQTMTDGLIPLVVQETPPVILDAPAQAELARQILSAPLPLQVPNSQLSAPAPGALEARALAQMLSIQRVQSDQGESYQVGINSDALRNFLLNIAPDLTHYPQNARFIF